MSVIMVTQTIYLFDFSLIPNPIFDLIDASI